jgi:hypothetical protein
MSELPRFLASIPIFGCLASLYLLTHISRIDDCWHIITITLLVNADYENLTGGIIGSQILPPGDLQIINSLKAWAVEMYKEVGIQEKVKL